MTTDGPNARTGPEEHPTGSPSAHSEGSEPRDGAEPMPIWLMTFFGGLLFWGGWYLSTYSGDWRGDMLDETPSALRAPATAPAEASPAALGKRIYTANCLVCHQGDGHGVPGQYPPLAASEWVNGNPARIKRIVLHGAEGQITVQGTLYNNAMPPWGAKLSNKQIAAVLTFVRGNAEWGNDSAPLSEESVAATRDATKGRASPWTAAELLAITEDEDKLLRGFALLSAKPLLLLLNIGEVKLGRPNPTLERI